ncbi:MAG: uroporphyrinogen decarboxylase family protein [Acidimicrobiia bacterium]
MSNFPENWGDLSEEQRLDHRLTAWASPGEKHFATPDAAAAYERRAMRFADVVRLRQPDRVPRLLAAGAFVSTYGGATHGEVMYDYERGAATVIKFHEDFDLDYRAPGRALPEPVFDRLGYVSYRWPGGTLAPHQQYQAVEGEYMTVDEYDDLIADPESFLQRVYLPRIFTEVGGWSTIPSFLGSVELPFLPSMMARFGDPEVQAAFDAFLEAGAMAWDWKRAMSVVTTKVQGELGYPALTGGYTKVPFDFVGDTLRGTRGVMLDMFRDADKLLAACEAIAPLAVRLAVDAANTSGNPFSYVVLHKGADAFMSTDDFARFYWPGFRAIIDGMRAEGIVPLLFVEGSYDNRLDLLADAGVPSGTTLWMFDQTDMTEVKRKIGPWAGIGGNVPASLFKVGTPEAMEAYVRELIEIAAPGGGFFLAPGAGIDDATEDNVRAYLAAGRALGAY